MMIPIQSGALLADTFTVLDAVPTPEGQHPRFRATDLTTANEVLVTVVPLTSGDTATLLAISNRLKKLSHPDIQPHLGLWQDADAAYLVDACLPEIAFKPLAKPLNPGQLRRLIAALNYAEALGFHQSIFDLAWLTPGDHQSIIIQHLGWPRWALTGAPIKKLDATGVFAFSEWSYQSCTNEPWQGLNALQNQPPLPAGLTPLITAIQQGAAANFGDLLNLLETNATEAAAGSGAVGPLQATAYEAATPATPGPATSTRAPTVNPPNARPGQSPWEPKTLLIGFALIILAGFVFWVLPDLIRSTDNAQTRPAQTVTLEPPLEPTRAPIADAKAKIKAEQAQTLAESFLRKLMALEDLGLGLWDPAALAQLNQDAMAADDAYRAGDGESALALYSQLLAAVNALEATLPDRRTDYLTRAQQALNQENSNAARKLWEISAQLHPQDSKVQATWQAVQQLPAISALRAEAQLAERAGQLADAQGILRAAVALFPGWMPSQAAFDHVSRALLQQQFQRAMSQGFAALAEESFDAAIKAFEQAARIEPKATSAQDGLEQVRQAQLKQQIQALFAQAQEAENVGSWFDAKNAYEAALTLAPNLTDIGQQIKTIDVRMGLAEALTQILSDPARLQSEAEFNRAGILAITLSQLSEPVGDLQTKLPILTRLLSHARRELTLTLTSDTQTTVTVLRRGEDGRLGQINQTALTLFPGRYVVTGTRQGYKDVRHEVTLTIDEPARTLSVVCDQPI